MLILRIGPFAQARLHSLAIDQNVEANSLGCRHVAAQFSILARLYPRPSRARLHSTLSLLSAQPPYTALPLYRSESLVPTPGGRVIGLGSPVFLPPLVFDFDTVAAAEGPCVLPRLEREAYSLHQRDPS